MSQSKPKSLQDVIDAGTNIVDVLRNAQNPAYVVPVVAAEYSSWRLEQRAWREAAVLFDQSHHMDNVIICGSDAIKLRRTTRAARRARDRQSGAVFCRRPHRLPGRLAHGIELTTRRPHRGFGRIPSTSIRTR
jgi:hypothetical protein